MGQHVGGEDSSGDSPRDSAAGADRPTEGPLTRVSRLTDLGVLRTIAHNTIEHGLSSAASAMAFDIFLGMIPLLALMGAIAGSLARSGKNVAFDLSFLDVAPGPAAELARSHLSRFETGTSFAPLVIMGFVWLSSSAAHVALATVRSILGLPARPYSRTRAIALGLTIAGIIVAAFASAGALVIHGMHVVGAFSEKAHVLWKLGLYATTVLITSVGLAALYRFAGGTIGKQRSLAPGAVLAALVFHGVSWAFSTYVKTLAKYTAFYGGLAAVAMMLIWLWLSSLAILMGAEANAVLDELRGRTPPRRAPN
ncbi:MAG: YihY/virulence factor BrkB family protein [Polyangiales bacterium]